MQFDEEIREFLIESNENLILLDQDIVHLEKSPGDIELVSSAFRIIHTIKGTCGFFGYNQLGAVTHLIENLLGQVREGKRVLSPELITLILEGVDEVKALIRSIEETGKDEEGLGGGVNTRLERECYRSSVLENSTLGVHAPDADATAKVAVVQSYSQEAPPNDSGSQVEALRPQSGFSSTVEGQIPGGDPALPVAPESPTIESDIPEQESEEGLLKAGGTVGDPVGSRDGSRETALVESTIRVDVGLLNRLINLVGELVLARNQLLQDASLQSPVLQQTCQRLNLITSELQEGVMKTRMQPIGVVWNKLPRVVRDLASQCGKQIRIEMEGANTELDKTIIEAIKDPLTHIVRNSCDHGIEAVSTRMAKGKAPIGTLMLRAYHEGGVVNIEISDDGAGISASRVKAKAVEKGLIRAEQAAQLSEREALHLIFLPGFSTAAQVTSISGRGVGMDVVKTNIEKIGGSVDVQNRREGGASVRIKIPLTLAIIPGLIVTLNGDAKDAESNRIWSREERFVIPQANLLELLRVDEVDLHRRINRVHGTPVLHHRDELLPLVYLDHVLMKPRTLKGSEGVNIVVLQAENRRLGVVVDGICDTQEIVVKPLGRHLKALTCYVGATIMGDGRPALILDVGGLARLAGLNPQGRPAPADTPQKSTLSTNAQTMLLFRAGGYSRVAVPLAFVDRLEEVACSRIEGAGGSQALHYRGSILPLLSFPEHGETHSKAEIQDSVQVIVFASGERRLGLIVDQIIDIVTDPITMPRPSSSTWILGSGVLANSIVDLLDLQAVIEASQEECPGQRDHGCGTPDTLVLVDKPGLNRDMTRDYLTVAGYRVLPASSKAEIQAWFESADSAVCVVTEELMRALSEPDCRELLEVLQSRIVPVIVLTSAGGRQAALPGATSVRRADRAGLLEAIASASGSATLQGGQHAYAHVS